MLVNVSSEPRAEMPVRWGLIAALLLPWLLIGFAPALAVRTFALEAFEADGPSMEPTLLHGDRFVVHKTAYGLFLPFSGEATLTWGAPAAGDVVVVHSPADDLDIIKRVIGAPGDTVEIRNDVVYRNGEPLELRVIGRCEESELDAFGEHCEAVEEGVDERRWRTSRSDLRVPDSHPPSVVPDGHVWVLGDHRDRSNDSRNPRIGMVPIARIKGRAAMIYWSSNEGGAVRWDRVFGAVR